MQQKRVADILTFLSRCKALETTERYGASLAKDKRNTVAEHSWRLALMALVIAQECNVALNMERALALAIMHDIAEAKTGDIDAYAQKTFGSALVDSKAAQEESVMKTMTSDLNFGSWVFDLWKEYEEQHTQEAKFIKALDKIEGFLHIAEVGVQAYVPKEFHADYADRAVAAFDGAAYTCPELSGLLAAVKENLRTQFEQAGVAWVE
jgi:putative hydrolase of HD superfamily